MNPNYIATDALRTAIKAAGWSVRTLARDLGYSKSHLYAVIRGDVPVRRAVAYHLADLVTGDIAVLFAVVTSEEE